MKILMVSMNSIHFRRWTAQLKDSGHEVHWFDATDGDPIPQLDWVPQHQGWRYKGGNFKGRTFIKKQLPAVHKLFEKDMAAAFHKVLKKVQPDVVHSFVMYKCSVPIFPVMQKYPKIKWIYSSWGSDLFHFKELPEHLADLQRVLPHIDYLFTDNMRDHHIAQHLGFKGAFLGAYPGGGGFRITDFQKFIKPFNKRKSILIKGYQGRSGRALNVLASLEHIPEILEPYDIVLFGADDEVVNYVESNDFLRKHIQIASTKKAMVSHEKVLQLMGEALLYVGNSASDGMPNTLLEAIVMGAFPIQSNPGNVSREVIEDGVNGLLINDPEDETHIAALIKLALQGREMCEKAFRINMELRARFDYDTIRKEVLNCYSQIENEI
ncbi:glycosyl transferase family 1 [Pukyongia salina]|uniref:Glycosyl transferase family 1 n=1 Tax=Pukyongia salina TaxID=2094025 RepID=A0A2S0HXT2_9FLAO|nr:glycosyltransferase [Pukyongia salina]AVI51438.1 glycosyl transferase family 1 [Pukyongia salina]